MPTPISVTRRRRSPARMLADARASRRMSGVAGSPSRISRINKRDAGFSTAAIFILILPMLLGAFGYAFDTLRITYTKRYLQGRLDLATQAGAAVTYTTQDGLIRLGDPGQLEGQSALAETYAVYAANTNAKRQPGSRGSSLLECSSSNVKDRAVPLTPDQVNVGPAGCAGVATVTGMLPDQGYDFCSPPTDGTAYGVRYEVTEVVPTVFLRFLGVDSVDMTLVSESLLRQRNC